MKLTLFVVVLLCVFFVCVQSDAANTPDETKQSKTLEEYQKLSVRTLKGILKAKGLDCKGCSEKADYAAKAFESQDLPDLVSEVKTKAGYSVPPGVDQDKIDELMANLKKGGFGNSKMFTPDDLKNMSPEELSEKLGGDKGSKSKGKKSKGKSSKASKKSRKTEVEVDDGGETIEL